MKPLGLAKKLWIAQAVIIVALVVLAWVLSFLVPLEGESDPVGYIVTNYAGWFGLFVALFVADLVLLGTSPSGHGRWCSSRTRCPLPVSTSSSRPCCCSVRSSCGHPPPTTARAPRHPPADLLYQRGVPGSHTCRGHCGNGQDFVNTPAKEKIGVHHISFSLPKINIFFYPQKRNVSVPVPGV